MALRYDILLNPTVMLCTILLVIIPLLVLHINLYLHKKCDPPWKQQDELEIEYKAVETEEVEA